MKPIKAVFFTSMIFLFGSLLIGQVLRTQPGPRPATVCGKVAVTEFYLANNNGIGVPAWSVITGQQYKLRMTIQNCTRSNLHNVVTTIDRDGAPWQISTFDFPAGATQTKEVSWTAEEGRHRFVAKIDPEGLLNEIRLERLDNTKTLTVSPQGVNTSPAITPIVDRELDYVKALNAGSGFPQGVSEGINTCTRLGVDDAQGSHPYVFGQPGVVFIADCPGLPNALTQGGRANPEAYKNFELKNGWKVKSISLKFSTNREDPTDWHQTLAQAQSAQERRDHHHNFSLDAAPAVGSTAPFLKAHLGVVGGAFLKVYVKIIIEGPANADPYGDAVLTPCGSDPTGNPAHDYVRVPVSSGGTICVLKADVVDCGSKYACATAGDCDPASVCVVTGCGNRCLVPKPPLP
jgi:hypothetical protein